MKTCRAFYCVASGGVVSGGKAFGEVDFYHYSAVYQGTVQCKSRILQLGNFTKRKA